LSLRERGGEEGGHAVAFPKVPWGRGEPKPTWGEGLNYIYWEGNAPMWESRGKKKKRGITVERKKDYRGAHLF